MQFVTNPKIHGAESIEINSPMNIFESYCDGNGWQLQCYAG